MAHHTWSQCVGGVTFKQYDEKSFHKSCTPFNVMVERFERLPHWIRRPRIPIRTYSRQRWLFFPSSTGYFWCVYHHTIQSNSQSIKWESYSSGFVNVHDQKWRSIGQFDSNVYCTNNNRIKWKQETSAGVGSGIQISIERWKRWCQCVWKKGRRFFARSSIYSIKTGCCYDTTVGGNDQKRRIKQ